ncbi:MAG: NADH-quinone oxidoreductase subunit NuoI [Ignavibacteria bacterium]|jgi:NADH-quinone oxidoreductase subunit I|nr:NADH-quinone oxidoreductase subunit NuoI [Ignavibacteria bacterium]MDH7528014.1 NADH-quinone oxidoreductase subunit NuoI [Ignavibacteria bacterium]NPV12386.1 NADH-quinone oxidoreductase subunit NuoI [Ignavibacteria bacterium]
MAVKKRKKDLNFFERIYIVEIIKGMLLTLKHFFSPKFTRQYPEEKYVQPPSYRGRPVLVMDNGKERCVACGLCSRVCPALAIQVQAAETADEKERYPYLFEINMLRCIFCGFCEEVCPEEAIVMSKDYELVFTKYEDAIFGKDKLLIPAEQLKDRIEFIRQYR